MMTFSQSIWRGATVLAVLLLCQCNPIKVKELDKPVHSIALGGEIEDSLSELERQRYDSLYAQIKLARKLEKSDAQAAMAQYFNVAEICWRENQGYLEPLYNHAVGQAVDLLCTLGPDFPSRYDGQRGSYQIVLAEPKAGAFSANQFYSLIPADCVSIDGIRTLVARPGIGAAMVAEHGLHNHKGEHGFLHPSGGNFPLTAVADFSKRGVVKLHFYDSTVTDTVLWHGQRRELAMNYTAPYGIAIRNQHEAGGMNRLEGVFKPVELTKKMGLFTQPLIDTNKIPLILVHGLVSSPLTWINPGNELMHDPTIRKHYQVYTFYYPTGLPVSMSGAALKRELLRLNAHYVSEGAASTADKMVIMGHSMGGMLTNYQVRVLGDEVWKKFSDKPISELDMSERARADLTLLLEEPRPAFLNRAVFIATPHYGSNMANNWFGSLVASLISIPDNLVKLRFVESAESLTNLGKTVFNRDGPVNGMMTLRVGNPATELMAGRPIAPEVTYHSIIGDRGKGDTPNSSDGMVPYSSSHIEGAASELIVPSGHSAHRHPLAVAEMRRILLLHLKEHKVTR